MLEKIITYWYCTG